MNSIQILIDNRMKELSKKVGNNKIKIYKYLWEQYSNVFDFDKVWDTKSEWDNKGIKFLQEGKFTELANETEKYFKPCLKDGEDINFDNFTIDCLIHISMDKEFEQKSNMFGNFNFRF